jgi:hypothetical protein
MSREKRGTHFQTVVLTRGTGLHSFKPFFLLLFQLHEREKRGCDAEMAPWKKCIKAWNISGAAWNFTGETWSRLP